MNWDDVLVILVVVGAILLFYGIMSQDTNWKENMFIEPQPLETCDRLCVGMFNGTVNGLTTDNAGNLMCNCTVNGKDNLLEII